MNIWKTEINLKEIDIDFTADSRPTFEFSPALYWNHKNFFGLILHLLKLQFWFKIIYSAQWLKNPPANSGDVGSIPGSGRSPGEGNGNPLQYSCLENPMDRGAWWATVHGVAKKLDTTKQLQNNNNSGERPSYYSWTWSLEMAGDHAIVE